MTPCHFHFSVSQGSMQGKKGICDKQEDEKDKVEEFVNMLGRLISK